MEMRPNPQCSNGTCIERQECLQARPIREVAAKAKLEVESAKHDDPLHVDNEWNISVVDDSEMESIHASPSSAALPEGLIHELPITETYPGAVTYPETKTVEDDLAELQRQLDALNAMHLDVKVHLGITERQRVSFSCRHRCCGLKGDAKEDEIEKVEKRRRIRGM